MRKKRLLLFIQIFKKTFLWKAISGYLITFFILAFVIMCVEPSITRYGDALWYSFVSATTIGFGDFAAIRTIGRLCTVILYYYNVLILALITASFTQYFFELAKLKRDESISQFQYDMEHLEDLPKERLKELSEKIKMIRI